MFSSEYDTGKGLIHDCVIPALGYHNPVEVIEFSDTGIYFFKWSDNIKDVL